MVTLASQSDWTAVRSTQQQPGKRTGLTRKMQRSRCCNKSVKLPRLLLCVRRVANVKRRLPRKGPKNLHTRALGSYDDNDDVEERGNRSQIGLEIL